MFYHDSVSLLKFMLFLFFLIAFAAPFSVVQKVQAKEIVISSTIGKVKDQIITSRDVKISYFIEEALASKKKGLSIKSLKLRSKKFSEQTNNLFLEWVIYFESQLFSVVKISQSEKSRAIAFVLQSGAKSFFWKRLYVTPKELDFLVRRKILSKKFIYFKIKSSQSSALDRDTADFYKRNKGKFEEKDLKKIKKAFDLSAKNKRIQVWLDTLRKKYKAKKFNVL